MTLVSQLSATQAISVGSGEVKPSASSSLNSRVNKSSLKEELVVHPRVHLSLAQSWVHTGRQPPREPGG